MGFDESTARRRELGADLRSLREQAGYDGHGIARALGWSEAKVSRLENGRRDVSELDVAIYLARCGTEPGKLDELLRLHREGNEGFWQYTVTGRDPDPLRTLIRHESTAETLTAYEPLVVPGLLQTEDYARAIFSVNDRLDRVAIEGRIAKRLERQDLLRRWRPPEFQFFIHEHAPRLPVGSTRVTHEQMLQLVFLSSRPRCDIRVVPVSAGPRTWTGGPVTLMTFAGHKPVL